MDPENENNQEHQIPPENASENLPIPSEEDIQAFIIAIKSGYNFPDSDLLIKWKNSSINSKLTSAIGWSHNSDNPLSTLPPFLLTKTFVTRW